MSIRVHQGVIAGGASALPAVPLNQYAVPFNVGFGICVTGTSAASTATVRVEHCFDTEVTAGTCWFTHVDVSGVLVSASAWIDGNYAYPITHARMFVVSVSGIPELQFHLLQTGH